MLDLENPENFGFSSDFHQKNQALSVEASLGCFIPSVLQGIAALCGFWPLTRSCRSLMQVFDFPHHFWTFDYWMKMTKINNAIFTHQKRAGALPSFPLFHKIGNGKELRREKLRQSVKQLGYLVCL